MSTYIGYVQPMTKTMPIEVRFWSKVEKAGPDDCWLWTATLVKGYGSLWPDAALSNGGRRRTIGAHVYSYMLHHGPVPSGACVLHSCDNPCCVNPKHLSLGDHGVNAREREARGRGNRQGSRAPRNVGAANAMAKLTDAQVAEIKRRLTAGQRGTAAALAREFGVVRSMISLIRTGKIWKHVQAPTSPHTPVEASQTPPHVDAGQNAT